MEEEKAGRITDGASKGKRQAKIAKFQVWRAAQSVSSNRCNLNFIFVNIVLTQN